MSAGRGSGGPPADRAANGAAAAEAGAGADAQAAPEAEAQVEFVDYSVHGEGIGRLPDGRVVFVPGAVPGDVAQVAVQPHAGRTAFGRILALSTPSPDRVVSRCDIAACGGCPVRGSTLTLQASCKGRRVRETLRRVGGLEPAALAAPLVPGDDGWGYRHRVRLHASWARAEDGRGHWQLGYHQRQSHALVPLSTCPVLWPELERLGRAVAAGMVGLPREAQLQTVELAYSRRDRRGGAKVVAKGEVAAFRQSLEWIEGSELSGIEVVAGDGNFRWGNTELRYDHAQADAFDLRYEAGLFTQANVAQNDVLVRQVLEKVAPRNGLRVLELHAGIGNFTLPIARLGARVAAYEQGRRAAVLLQKNARAAGVDVEVHAKSDVEAVTALATGVDVLLMDPPRSGIRALAPKLAALGQHLPAKIVYVSCDPATLARDAAYLAGAGRKLQDVVPVDMFSQTTHVETIAVFG